MDHERHQRADDPANDPHEPESAGWIQAAARIFGERFVRNWSLALRIAPIVIVLVAAKGIVDVTGASFIDLTTLFGSVIAANVFVLGFLLAGTLSDYKESERLPGELASSIEVISDECLITYKNKRAKEAQDALMYMADFAASLLRWFHKEERTATMLDKVTGMNDIFLQFEALTQPNFIVRLKQEQNSIRRIILRIDAIRDTDFLPAGYILSYAGTAALVFGILFANIEPYWEAMFYMAAVGFLMLYLTLLIRDIDNPFDYYVDGLQGATVSLRAISDMEARIRESAEEVAAESRRNPVTAGSRP
jgi:hypothetical protein